LATPIAAYLETVPKRSFACAIDWPGWCRSGKTEDDALASLVAYGPRYNRAVKGARTQFDPPKDVGDIEIIDRLVGNASTQFGIPALPTTSDADPLQGEELERQIVLLQAAWHAADAAAEAAHGVELRKGPRGGGRDVDRIVEHVLGGEEAYLSELGAKAPKSPDPAPRSRLLLVREASIALLRSRAEGFEPEPRPRRKSPFWSPRYFIRRSAWHSLDHAWEIEDRAAP
jgi:hypothetical protein